MSPPPYSESFPHPETAPTETPAAALPQLETGATSSIQRQIRPLGDQIIIRVIPPSSVGSIIIPDSAKGSTHQGEDGSLVHFVEAEVIAVGPGKPPRGSELIRDLAKALSDVAPLPTTLDRLGIDLPRLLERAYAINQPIPLEVQAGDRILFHPAVQSFDRKINPELIGLKPEDGDCYIIGEHSVLAILDKDE